MVEELHCSFKNTMTIIELVDGRISLSVCFLFFNICLSLQSYEFNSSITDKEIS